MSLCHPSQAAADVPRRRSDSLLAVRDLQPGFRCLSCAVCRRSRLCRGAMEHDPVVALFEWDRKPERCQFGNRWDRWIIGQFLGQGIDRIQIHLGGFVGFAKRFQLTSNFPDMTKGAIDTCLLFAVLGCLRECRGSVSTCTMLFINSSGAKLAPASIRGPAGLAGAASGSTGAGASGSTGFAFNGSAGFGAKGSNGSTGFAEASGSSGSTAGAGLAGISGFTGAANGSSGSTEGVVTSGLGGATGAAEFSGSSGSTAGFSGLTGEALPNGSSGSTAGLAGVVALAEDRADQPLGSWVFRASRADPADRSSASGSWGACRLRLGTVNPRLFRFPGLGAGGITRAVRHVALLGWHRFGWHRFGRIAAWIRLGSRLAILLGCHHRSVSTCRPRLCFARTRAGAFACSRENALRS